MYPEKSIKQKEMEILLEEFYQKGFALLPSVLEETEIRSLREAGDRLFADPKYRDTDQFQSEHNALRVFETGPEFESMIDREPFISIAENVLGDNCHLMAMNLWRIPSQGIEYAFHIDEEVFFPLPRGVLRHDPQIRMNIFFLTFQIPLSNLSCRKFGPTEYVPGSHYSGREPNDLVNPEFEGQGKVPMLCKIGDAYIHNGQCWHRPSINSSGETRYLLQVLYARRWVSQRFYPYINYQIPSDILDRANTRRRRILGLHPLNG